MTRLACTPMKMLGPHFGQERFFRVIFSPEIVYTELASFPFFFPDAAFLSPPLAFGLVSVLAMIFTLLLLLPELFSVRLFFS